MNVRRFYVQRDSAGMGGEAGGGQGEAGAGAAAGGNAGAAGAGGGDGAAAGGGAGAGGGTALSAGAAAGGGHGGGGAAAAGAAVAGTAESGVPDKFVVKDAAGQIDHAATSLKVAEAYGHLEKRFGSGDAPPADASGYKVNVPDALAPKINPEELAANAGFKDFLGKAHAAGLTQKQVDVVVADFLERSLAIQDGAKVMQQADCEAELRQAEGWQSDEQYMRNVSMAFGAGTQIFGKDFDGIVKDYGNDPRLIRGLASIGKEMQEDMPASPEAQAQLQENLDQMMSSKAYLNANDPQHAATMAKVTALTAKLAGQRPVAGGRTHSFKSG